MSAGSWSLWPVTDLSEAVCWVNAGSWSLWFVTDLSEAICWVRVASWSFGSVTDLLEAVFWVNEGLWSFCPVRDLSKAVCCVTEHWWSLCSVTDLPEAVLWVTASSWSLWPHGLHRAVERHCVAAPAGGPLAHCCCPQARSGEGQSHREATFWLYVTSQELVFQAKQVIQGFLCPLERVLELGTHVPCL